MSFLGHSCFISLALSQQLCTEMALSDWHRRDTCPVAALLIPTLQAISSDLWQNGGNQGSIAALQQVH